MKKLCSVILICVLLLPAFPVSAAEVVPSARAWVLYCADSGEVLLSDHADERLPMASTTKIMTALLALEEADRDNRIVTFTDEMIAEGSSMYLQVGERVTLYDLAVGMMMQSGNDAANAAAIALSGSYDAFADKMNARAKELGMQDTHFVTPSGLDDPEHVTTAKDMAVLMTAALSNNSFKEIIFQTSMQVTFTEPADKTVTYPNHNRLLKMYPDCIGGKTGYTDTAGRCLVSAACHDGLTLVAVTLDDPDDWDDHMALYDYGFAHYRAISVGEEDRFTVDVVGGIKDHIALSPDQPKTIVVPADRAGEVRRRVYVPDFLYAPVEQGRGVGSVAYLLDDRVLYEAPLIPSGDVPQSDRKRGLIEKIKDLLHWHS